MDDWISLYFNKNRQVVSANSLNTKIFLRTLVVITANTRIITWFAR